MKSNYFNKINKNRDNVNSFKNICYEDRFSLFRFKVIPYICTCCNRDGTRITLGSLKSRTWRAFPVISGTFWRKVY